MSFHEVLFPPEVAYGASGGPKFKTAVFTADSGFEQRTLDWKDVRAEYDVSHTVKNPEQQAALLDFFMCRRGMAYGFRFKDWNDFTLKQEVIAKGNNVERVYQVTKRYTSDQGAGQSWTYDRKITKIAWNTMAGVTVNDIPAKRCYSPFYFDAGVAVHAYTLDEDTGVMVFRDAPDGILYDGTTPAMAMTFQPSGVNFGVQQSTTIDSIVCDFDSGKAFFKGVGAAGSGIRRVDLTTGAEDAQTSSVAINFPSTNPTYDDRRIDGVVAAADGRVYVTVGGSNTRVLYALDQDDFSILDSYGVAAGDITAEGGVAQPYCPAAISNDKTRLMLCNLVGGATGTFPIFDITSGIDYSGYANVGAVSSINLVSVCPLYDSGFAIVIERAGKIELWDDAGNKLLVVGETGCAGLWCVWDGGNDKGVVFAWTDANGAYLTKYSMNTQSAIWTVDLPVGATATYVSPCTRFGDTLAFNTTARTYFVDTQTGVIAARVVANGSVIQAYDGTGLRIANQPAGGRVLDCDVDGLAFDTNVEVKIGYCEFHVPVRFDTDHIEISHDAYEVSSWSGIPLIEVRDWSEIKL